MLFPLQLMDPKANENYSLIRGLGLAAAISVISFDDLTWQGSSVGESAGFITRRSAVQIRLLLPVHKIEMLWLFAGFFGRIRRFCTLQFRNLPLGCAC